MYDRWFNLNAAFNPRTGLARIRMQVTGQNATSGGFILSADSFIFTRQP